LLGHIRDCCGRGDFLEEVLSGCSIEDACRTEDHNYFFFCLAIMICSGDTSIYDDAWYIIPFLKFSMEHRRYGAYDLSYIRDSQAYTPKSLYVNVEQLHVLVKMLAWSVCCEQLVGFACPGISLRGADLLRILDAGVDVPDVIAEIYKECVPIAGCNKTLLEFANEESAGNIKVDKVEICLKFFAIDLTPSEGSGEDGFAEPNETAGPIFGGEVFSDDGSNVADELHHKLLYTPWILPSYMINTTMHTYTQGGIFNDRWVKCGEIAWYDLCTSGILPPTSCARPCINGQRLFNFLRDIQDHEISLIWGPGDELILKRDSTAKSARK